MKKIQFNNLTMIVNRSFGVVVVVTIFVISSKIVKSIQAEKELGTIPDSTNPTLRLLLGPLVKSMKNATSKQISSVLPPLKPKSLNSNNKTPVMDESESSTKCSMKSPLEEIQEICCSQIAEERFPLNKVYKKVYEIRCEGERIVQLSLHMMSKSFRMTNKNKGFLGNIDTPTGKEILNTVTALVRKINMLPISLLTQQGTFDIENIFEILQGGSPSCASPNTVPKNSWPRFNLSGDSGDNKKLPRLFQMFRDISKVAQNELVSTIEQIMSFLETGLEFLPSLTDLLSGENLDSLLSIFDNE